MQRPMHAWRQRISLLVPATILIVAVVGVPWMVLGPNGLPRYRRLEAQYRAQLEENRRLTREDAQLQAEIEGFAQDVRMRERAARDELGWVRPDEVVIEIPNGRL